MNKFQKKAAVAVMMIASMAAFSTSAHAQEASVDKVLAQVVFNQGTRVMNDISEQLKQSIQQKLNQFSIDHAVTWLSEEQNSALTKTQTEQVTTTEKSSDE